MPRTEDFDEQLRKQREEELRETIEKMSRKVPMPEVKAPKGTAVDGPAHYNGYQVLEAICDAGLAEGFCLGNAVKYLLRARSKGKHHQDLEKAKFYLDWYLDHYDEYKAYNNVGE